MTMIAFATYGDHAEFITDSTSYTLNGSALSQCTKALPLPHLDMAVLTQGDHAFAEDARLATMQVSSQLETFDAVAEEMPRHFRELWVRRQAETDSDIDAMVFLVGYSERLGRFTAWSFASDRENFTPAPADAPYVMPCPWTLRPDALQVKRFRAWDRDAAASHGVTPQGHKVVAQWMERPSLSAPTSLAEWVDLARLVRAERAATDYATVYVAGNVFHTRLGRGEVVTSKIHSYDDTGVEFETMIAGTQHPVAQLLPCWCDSGKTFLECHLVDQLDEPCGCKRHGRTFRECCAVSDKARRPPADVA